MRDKKGGNAVAKPISLQALEQRYLLDAAAVATVADAAADAAIETDLNEAIQQLPAFAGVPVHEQGGETEPPEFLDIGPVPQTNEIVFIDSGVSNVQELITDISPTALVYFIDTAEDGIEQISEILADYSDVDALHIISHGEQGGLCLLYTSPSPRD